MIAELPNDSLVSLEIFDNKITLFLENQQSDCRQDMLRFFNSINKKKYYAILGKENIMIPFLTIKDNLVIGLSKKEKEQLKERLPKLLDQFKLSPSSLNKPASDCSLEEQVVFQIVRSLALRHIILIFDSTSNQQESNQFLTNLIPVLRTAVKNNHGTIAIVSSSQEVAGSLYYDQCINLDYFFN